MKCRSALTQLLSRVWWRNSRHFDEIKPPGDQLSCCLFRGVQCACFSFLFIWNDQKHTQKKKEMKKSYKILFSWSALAVCVASVLTFPANELAFVSRSKADISHLSCLGSLHKRGLQKSGRQRLSRRLILRERVCCFSLDLVWGLTQVVKWWNRIFAVSNCQACSQRTPGRFLTSILRV